MNRYKWTFMAIAVIGLAVYCYTKTMDYNCPGMVQCVEAGSDAPLQYSGLTDSVKGFAKVNSGRAILTIEGDRTAYLLKVTPGQNDDWSQGISQLGLKVKGVSVSSVNEPMVIHIVTKIPDVKAEGKMGEIKYFVNVIYPKLNQEDDFVTRSVKKMSYSDKNESFEFSLPVVVVKNGFFKSLYAKTWFYILLVVGIVWLLWSMLMWPRKKVRRKQDPG